MMSSDRPAMPQELSLEPLAPQPRPAPAAAAPAKFQIDTRSKQERRTQADRRDSIRFQDDRRSHQERRASAGPWGTTGNL